MKDRIKKIMESQHMSQKVFAQFTGISEGSLSGVFNGRTRPTIQMVESIHSHLPNISVEWMLFGTGPMYTDSLSVASGELSPGTDAHQEGQQSLLSPSLFEGQSGDAYGGVAATPNRIDKTITKYIDKPERRITEIRIFYDDQTWETFTPKS